MRPTRATSNLNAEKVNPNGGKEFAEYFARKKAENAWWTNPASPEGAFMTDPITGEEMGMQETLKLRNYYNQLEADAKQARYEESMKNAPRHGLSAWDAGADRAAAAQQKRTADAIGMIGMGPIAIGGLGIAAAPVLGATTLSPILATSVSFKNLAIASSVSATINGSINAGQQYYKYGEIKYPAELVISTAMGSLEGPVGAYGGIFFNGVVGASSNAITATIVNDYYNYDKDHNGGIYKTTAVGFGFGAGGKYVDDRYISPFLSKYFKF